MKVRKHRHKCLTTLLMSIFLTQAVAQYEIKKHSINNGSDVMQGNTFEVRSSIGQVDAGKKMTSGQFELSGGFWTAANPSQDNDLIFKDDFE